MSDSWNCGQPPEECFRPAKPSKQKPTSSGTSLYKMLQKPASSGTSLCKMLQKPTSSGTSLYKMLQKPASSGTSLCKMLQKPASSGTSLYKMLTQAQKLYSIKWLNSYTAETTNKQYKVYCCGQKDRKS